MLLQESHLCSNLALLQHCTCIANDGEKLGNLMASPTTCICPAPLSDMNGATCQDQRTGSHATVTAHKPGCNMQRLGVFVRSASTCITILQGLCSPYLLDYKTHQLQPASPMVRKAESRGPNNIWGPRLMLIGWRVAYTWIK